MDFVKVKNMVRENGDKVIFMENGEPSLVVMSFAEYEKFARLHLPNMNDVVQAKPNVREDEPMRAPYDPEKTHGTEFVAPIDTAPIRAASMTGYNRPVILEKEELMQPSDIRLEDLPI